MEIDVYVPHRKYQVKPYSSPWFSAPSAAPIVYRNHFFRLYQKDQSSGSKVEFRQASNRCKRVLETAKPAYANKTRESITSQKLCSRDSGEFPKVFSTKVNLLYLLCSTAQRCCLLHLIKKLFAENFSKNSNLDDSGMFLPVSPSRTNLKLHNISITPKMGKKAIMSLDLSKTSGPDCIPVVVLKNSDPKFLTYQLNSSIGV